MAKTRKWKVAVHATITKEITYEKTCEHASSMGDAVNDVLDYFRMEHSDSKFKIDFVEASAEHDTPEKDD